MQIPSSCLFRQGLSRFATGVAVLTAEDEGVCQGMTINSLSSVSLNPPLILFSLKTASPRCAFFWKSKKYAISILSRHQADHADYFARHSRADWKEASFLTLKETPPLLKGALATLIVEPEAHYKGGDHTIFLCRVISLDFDQTQEPLLFYKSSFVFLEEEGNETKKSA